MGNTPFKFAGLKFNCYADIRETLDEKVQDYLDWFLPKYVDAQMRPLKVVIVGDSKTLVGPWDDASISYMYSVVSCLCFAYIWNSNMTTNFLCAENFMLYNMPFEPTVKSFKKVSGSLIIETRAYPTSVAENIKFISPDGIPRFTRTSNIPIGSIFDGLSEALQKDSTQNSFRRIIRSINIYNIAFSNTGMLSIHDRLVLLVTAFEALFQNYRSGRKAFACAILKYWSINHIQTKCQLEDFFIKVYSIRSDYTHGNEVSVDAIVNSKFGNLFRCLAHAYGITIKRLLIERGYIKYSPKPDVNNDLPNDINVELMLLFSMMDEPQTYD